MIYEKESENYILSDQLKSSVTIRDKFSCGRILGRYSLSHPHLYAVRLRYDLGYLYLYDPLAGWFGNSHRCGGSHSVSSEPHDYITWVPGKTVILMEKLGGYAEYCASRIVEVRE